MKYSEMVKFLNDNGICVMQPVIASEVDAQLEHSIPEEEFEDICEKVEDAYLCSSKEPVIWELVRDELERRERKRRLQYLREKEKVCPLDKDEMYELTELEFCEEYDYEED